jgi:hypothetical protein
MREDVTLKSLIKMCKTVELLALHFMGKLNEGKVKQLNI